MGADVGADVTAGAAAAQPQTALAVCSGQRSVLLWVGCMYTLILAQEATKSGVETEKFISFKGSVPPSNEFP